VTLPLLPRRHRVSLPFGQDTLITPGSLPGRQANLEDENRRLKQLVADLSLDNQMLKHVASKN
jgi:hypothetical protein